MNGYIQTSEFKRKLLSERIHYRAPYNYVVLTARIQGKIPLELLKSALNQVRIKHPLLRSRIELEKDGSAWFTQGDVQELPIEVVDKVNDTQWIERTITEYKKQFQLDKGPLIRFILLESQHNSDLMIVCQHTICDGMSLVYLTRDIMTYIGNPRTETEPFDVPPVLDLNCFKEPVKIGFLPKLVLGHFDKAWKKQKTVFFENDYKKIYSNFWNQEKLNIATQTIDENSLNSLVLSCRDKGITINSAVSTAFIIAQNVIQNVFHHFSKTGIAVNLRNRMANSPGEGMGLFAGGCSVGAKYSKNKSFWTLAREFDIEAKRLLAKGNSIYDMLLFNLVDQSLIDGVYFHLFGNFENKTVALFTKLLHFDKKAPGLGVTNLGRVEIPQVYGSYKLDTLFFVPPNIPSGEKILGIITIGGRMNITLSCLESSLDAITTKKVLEYAIACLKKSG
jgi:NRPS condensation-like uncharacterized protein